MLHKYIGNPIDQQVNKLGAQELYLLVVVVYIVKHLLYPIAGIITFFIVKELQEQFFNRIDRNNTQAVCILKINNAVTNIIGRFHQVYKGMARINIFAFRQLWYAQFFGY